MQLIRPDGTRVPGAAAILKLSGTHSAAARTGLCLNPSFHPKSEEAESYWSSKLMLTV